VTATGLPAVVEAPTNEPATVPTGNAPVQTTPSTAASGSNGGLSTGAKAGIGAGIGIVALIALIALGFFLYKRRTIRAANTAKLEAKDKKGSAYLSVYTSDHKYDIVPQQLSTGAAPVRFELDAPPVELPSVSAATELPVRAGERDVGGRSPDYFSRP
jgi:hypothetical protein